MSDESSSPKVNADELSPDHQRRIVRERYADIATSSTDCCGGADTTACDDATDDPERGVERHARSMGYSGADLEVAPAEANLGLGCGNPTAIASLETGDTVLDLGAGAGFDCFLAAREVGPDGQVIGVDMTPEMVERARKNAEKNDVANVEFRLGEIEHLPVGDESVDVIISNCVVNLSPSKAQVFRDAARVLRPGGRLAISDVVQTAPFPPGVRTDPDAVSACVAGASTVSELESLMEDAGFTAVSIEPMSASETFIREWDDERDLSEYLVSATIEGKKPTN